MPQEELERDIFATGFYQQKAKSLRGTMRMLLEEFDGEVPRTLDELVRLPGVARKTANVVSSELGKPQRYRRRHARAPALAAARLHEAGGSGEDRARLISSSRATDWARFPHLLIWHGRRVCDRPQAALRGLRRQRPLPLEPCLSYTQPRGLRRRRRVRARAARLSGRGDCEDRRAARPAAGRAVLDLAAGTGKLTRLLVPCGANVIAVEPVREMRAELERRVPRDRALGGTAERMPLNDG